MKKASISFTCTFFMQKSNIVESKIIAIPVELVIACCRQLLENTSLVVHFFLLIELQRFFIIRIFYCVHRYRVGGSAVETWSSSSSSSLASTPLPFFSSPPSSSPSSSVALLLLLLPTKYSNRKIYSKRKPCFPHSACQKKCTLAKIENPSATSVTSNSPPTSPSSSSRRPVPTSTEADS